MAQPSARDALVTALLKLAAERPVETIRVNEVCEAAGISRATFYRVATTPADLLAEELRTLHQRRRGDYAKLMSLPGGHNPSLYITRISLVMADVLDHADIYRHSFTQSPSVLSSELVDYIRAGIVDFIGFRQDTIEFPDHVRDLPSDMRDRILSSHFASGMIGIIRAWIEEDDRLPVKAIVQIFFELAPRWYLKAIGLD